MRIRAAALEEAGEPHLAALHLLSTGDTEGGVRCYLRAGLLVEAVAAAAARLLPEDPLLQVRSKGTRLDCISTCISANGLVINAWPMGFIAYARNRDIKHLRIDVFCNPCAQKGSISLFL